MRYLDTTQHDLNRSDRVFLPDIDPTDREVWSAPDLPAPELALGRWTQRVVFATALWSVCELPFEVWFSRTTQEVVCCVAAKLVWLALVLFVLAGSRLARLAYAFLCTIGLMAVAFGLPAEYRVFPLGFLLSSVECVLKATAFVCLVSAGIYPEEA
ncbi:hypothetical protein B0G76_1869 [Paraburkholderia sp. BL23I1N1]|uniref:hypothetical protein n=1 Tax=Paraburkholderia sp. BL23I1N1 TaxID=1938802 RepID=UPI000E7403BC|nr:hypothetical protein [Paraburkholderia sp. BL23I1N1]RKE35745.1 hypothetical protein B0G76_1869 [Paraburkholderia sp. BL23I1N1]